MTANIRRVAIYEVRMRCHTYGILEGLAQKLPLVVFQKLFDMGDLIYDLCDIGFCKTLGFVAIGNIEVVVFVEPHHSIETGTIQEKKVQRLMVFVEPVADFIIVIGISAFEFLTFSFKKCADFSAGNETVFYSVIKADDVGIDVCKYSVLRLNVETDNTRPHEWLIPNGIFAKDNIFSNQRNEFCLNALNFKGRNKYFFVHFTLLLEVLQLFNSGGSPLYCRYSEKDESFLRLLPERISILPKFAQ